jgi:AcrR family transcriptional regulator
MEEKIKARGRPRAYDPEKVLDQAAELFWANGFEATSLDDLSVAMGMGRPSIYNAFGDKEALFLKALERYRDTIGSTPLAAMAGKDSVSEAFDAFFQRIVAYTTGDSRHPGCLMGSVAVSTELDPVKHFLTESLEWLEQQLGLRLQAAIDAGQLPAGYPVGVGARRATNAMIALTVRARIGTTREELMADAHAATAAVLGATV